MPKDAPAGASSAAAAAAGAAGRSKKAGAPSASRSPSSTTASRAIPFNRDLFRRFIKLVTATFYDDIHFVVCGFLAREERAVLEKEIKDRLDLYDKQLREALVHLEQEMILECEKPWERAKGSPAYWRIHPNVVHSVKWRLDELDRSLKQAVSDAFSMDEFVCPRCGEKYTSLKVQLFPRHPDDGHFLCEKCMEKLKAGDSVALRALTTERETRARRQLATLMDVMNRIQHMQMIHFPLPVKEKQTQVADSDANKITQAASLADASILKISKDTGDPSGQKKTSKAIPWLTVPKPDEVEDGPRAAVMAVRPKGEMSGVGMASRPGGGVGGFKIEISTNPTAGVKREAPEGLGGLQPPAKKPATRSTEHHSANDPRGNLMDVEQLLAMTRPIKKE